ncbi:MAG TPA: DinB family protein [Longimicrobiaceae bacterium]|nr:DinB family protein [Longimicrobiaceae bacterium]
MTERERIEDELRRAWDGDPWHGSPVRELLDGVTAQQAAAHPIAGAHGIWELVLHMTSWTREVLRRLHDGVARDPQDGDWPAVVDTSDEAWHAAIQALGDAHAQVAAAVGELPQARMDEMIGEARDRPAGSGVSYAVLLHGLAQHHAYHAGQIALLRKAFG